MRETVAAGIRMGSIRHAQLKGINVETTVQTKAARYPMDGEFSATMHDFDRSALVS